MASGPTVAYAGIKRIANETVLCGLAAELELEAVLQQQQGATFDLEEGIAAFAERRAPRFRGR